MKLKKLKAKNFKSLENLEVSFDDNFTTISGRNDAGKSNIFEAIKLLIGSSRYDGYNPVSLDFDSDFPKWKDAAGEQIIVCGDIALEAEADLALKQFIQRQMALDNSDISEFSIEISKDSKSSQHGVVVRVADKEVDGQAATEIWRRLRSEPSLIFHNSTTDAFRLSWAGPHGSFSELSQTASAIMSQFRSDLKKKMKREMASSQAELQSLLGRLSDKWKVSLDLPDFDEGIPFNIMLGDNSVSVPLNSWGSGTKNRAMIVLAMVRASQFRKSTAGSDKAIPVVVIEEPESFLHPSAQAEFGSLLIDLSRELDIQVVIATHSAYLLNTNKPSSNLLVSRNKHRNQFKESFIEKIEEEGWMKPFAEVLGLSSDSLSPWRDMIGSRGKKVILVEGKTDFQYLTYMKDEIHGDKKLSSDIDIVPYGGFGSITNQSALKVMIEMAKSVVITYDLDVHDKVKGTLLSLSLRKGYDYISIGKDSDGERCIEGLLPDYIKDNVMASNPKLFRGLLDRSASDKSIRSKIKDAYLKEFEKSAIPGSDLQDLYTLCAQLNKILA